MDDAVLEGLIARADLDGLVRLIDVLGAGNNWDAVLDVRNQSRAALLTGRQLWPAATLAEYRLALHGPPRLAALVVLDRPGRFAVGPLTEVIAQHHTWDELARFFPEGPEAAYIIQERLMRGEVLADDERARRHPDVLGLPVTLHSWEPRYGVATYDDVSVTADPPSLPPGSAHDSTAPNSTTPNSTTSESIAHDQTTPPSGQDVDDGSVFTAVRGLVEPWLAESNGTLAFHACEGPVTAAVQSLSVGATRCTQLTPRTALSWLQWAGASGGAFGRRRGGAAGRSAAWWVARELAGIDDADDHASDDDEFDNERDAADELGEAVNELQWYWWDEATPSTGWQLRLAVHDPLDGLSWAWHASDHV